MLINLKFLSLIEKSRKNYYFIIWKKTDFPLFCFDIEVSTSCPKAKFLEVVLNEHIRFASQVSYPSKCSNTVTINHKFRYCSDKKSLEVMYQRLVYLNFTMQTFSGVKHLSQSCKP